MLATLTHYTLNEGLNVYNGKLIETMKNLLIEHYK